MTTTTDTIDVAELDAWAKGDLRLMAAVKFLDDTDLIRRPVIAKHAKTDYGVVYFDFDSLRRSLNRIPFSSGEKAAIEAALSLAGKLDIDLGGLAISLGRTYMAALVDAITLDQGRMR